MIAVVKEEGLKVGEKDRQVFDSLEHEFEKQRDREEIVEVVVVVSMVRFASTLYTVLPSSVKKDHSFCTVSSRSVCVVLV